jgi:hypothetical protein
MPSVFPIALNVRWDEEGCRSGLDGNFGHGFILLFANSILRVIEVYRTLLITPSRDNARWGG